MEVVSHTMHYAPGWAGVSAPNWYCSCGLWEFAAVSAPNRRTGNNKIEATRSFKVHAGER